MPINQYVTPLQLPWLSKSLFYKRRYRQNPCIKRHGTAERKLFLPLWSVVIGLPDDAHCKENYLLFAFVITNEK